MSNAILQKWSIVRLDPKSSTYIAEANIKIQKACEIGREIIEQAKSEPFLFQDKSKSIAAEELIRNFILNGEVFFALIDDKVVAYCALRDLNPANHAEFELYIVPEHRKTFLAHEIRQTITKYAFTPYPEGLGLLKCKAAVCPMNKTAIKALKQCQFAEIALLPLHALFNRQHYPMLYLELYHPDIARQMQPEIMEVPNEQRTVSPRSSNESDSLSLLSLDS
jgi:RimJ/RimL family protein N-acetyltransferase